MNVERTMERKAWKEKEASYMKIIEELRQTIKDGQTKTKTKTVRVESCQRCDENQRTDNTITLQIHNKKLQQELAECQEKHQARYREFDNDLEQLQEQNARLQDDKNGQMREIEKLRKQIASFNEKQKDWGLQKQAFIKEREHLHKKVNKGRVYTTTIGVQTDTKQMEAKMKSVKTQTVSAVIENDDEWRKKEAAWEKEKMMLEMHLRDSELEMDLLKDQLQQKKIDFWDLQQKQEGLTKQSEEISAYVLTESMKREEIDTSSRDEPSDPRKMDKAFMDLKEDNNELRRRNAWCMENADWKKKEDSYKFRINELVQENMDKEDEIQTLREENDGLRSQVGNRRYVNQRSTLPESMSVASVGVQTEDTEVLINELVSQKNELEEDAAEKQRLIRKLQKKLSLYKDEQNVWTQREKDLLEENESLLKTLKKRKPRTKTISVQTDVEPPTKSSIGVQTEKTQDQNDLEEDNMKLSEENKRLERENFRLAVQADNLKMFKRQHVKPKMVSVDVQTDMTCPVNSKQQSHIEVVSSGDIQNQNNLHTHNNVDFLDHEDRITKLELKLACERQSEKAHYEASIGKLEKKLARKTSQMQEANTHHETILIKLNQELADTKREREEDLVHHKAIVTKLEQKLADTNRERKKESVHHKAIVTKLEQKLADTNREREEDSVHYKAMEQELADRTKEKVKMKNKGFQVSFPDPQEKTESPSIGTQASIVESPQKIRHRGCPAEEVMVEAQEIRKKSGKPRRKNTNSDADTGHFQSSTKSLRVSEGEKLDKTQTNPSEDLIGSNTFSTVGNVSSIYLQQATGEQKRKKSLKKRVLGFFGRN